VLLLLLPPPLLLLLLLLRCCCCCPQEDPKTLLKVDLPLPKGKVFEQLAWGPDGTIAASLGEHIHFIDGKRGQVR
jgi:hypothetical protein